MPTIYNNIEKHLEEGLKRTLEKAKRADFCIGYFNLRGWQKVADLDFIINYDIKCRMGKTLFGEEENVEEDEE